MTQETKIIGAILASKECFRTAQKWINPEHELSPAGQLIWNLVEEFYELDSKPDRCDRDILKERLRGRVKSKHVALYEGLLTTDIDISAVNAIDLVREYKQGVAGQELQAALSGSDKTRVKDCIDRYLALEGHEEYEDDRLYQGEDSILSVIGESDTASRIRLAPEQLFSSTGGSLRGHHIIVFARPETGKSLWAINQVAEWLQSGYRVLYVGNEDPARSILTRLGSRLAGDTISAFTNSTDSCFRAYRNSLVEGGFYDRFMLAEFVPGTRYREIHKLVEEFKPDCVVVDQMYNMGSPGTTKTEQLASASVAGRALAKKFNVLVLQVTQAGDSATNKLVLEQNDVEYSNTGVCAQGDLLIGLGINQDLERRGQLMVSICKNKLSSSGHPFFPVQVDRERSLIT